MSDSGSSDRPLARRTLRGRVSLLGLAVIAGWVAVVTVGLNVVLANRLGNQADVVLRTRAITAAATVAVTSNGVTVRENDGDGELDSGIWVYAHGKAVAQPSGSHTRLSRLTASLTAAPGYHSQGDDKFYVRPVHREGRTVATVVASQSDVPYERARDELLIGSVVVALLVVIGSYPVLRVASGRALRPVGEMTRQAGEWSAHGLNERFGDQQPYQEVEALAATLNAVLDRLAAIVRHERRLSAELSHELRTPLSRIIAETDLLLARPKTADQLAAAHSAVRDSAMAMETILETLLSAAREDVRFAPGRSDVADVLRSMRLGETPDGDGPAVSVRVDPGLAVGVDAVVVERILAPITHNAMRYARHGFAVSAVHDSSSVIIDVIDDGPGVPPELRDAIFEPGRRGTPDDGHDGAGLGLALSRRLARAASGDVEVVDPDSRFRVRLPPA